jgi:hypothetical protein|uniref:Uncharacterized protein n=1 Tax=Desulfobacca acetoxidans TaxID=60893 RepID=A0A7C3WQ59_9BACT
MAIAGKPWVGEGRVARHACQCGGEHFRVTRLHREKDLLAVRCALCGAFYAYLIPDLGNNGLWRVVHQN